ncbi:hypothetical protein D3C75_1001750 [compost metagenome]
MQQFAHAGKTVLPLPLLEDAYVRGVFSQMVIVGPQNDLFAGVSGLHQPFHMLSHDSVPGFVCFTHTLDLCLRENCHTVLQPFQDGICRVGCIGVSCV